LDAEREIEGEVEVDVARVERVADLNFVVGGNLQLRKDILPSCSKKRSKKDTNKR